MTNHPLIQLILARTREFYRQPEAVFWVYVFPLLLAVGLGIAFRTKSIEQYHVDIVEHKGQDSLVNQLSENEQIKVEVHPVEVARNRLRIGKSSLVISLRDGVVEYAYDPTRPESSLARDHTDDIIQRARGRVDPVTTSDQTVTEAGSRYIDFLIPGLLGMNLMGGGLWGIGFVTVDMRIRKLLKRFLATPMKRSHFLLALMISRMMFMIPEVILLVVFARYVFGVTIQGNIATLAILIFLGAVCFSGIGLLVASRAKTLESVSGLMNLVMLPMWMLSGIFFSADRYPDVAQPIIRKLPLTAVIDAIRAVMLEGATLMSQSVEVITIVCYATISFAVALFWFRWE